MTAAPVVYIVGAYRADTPWEVELNVRAAESASMMLVALGVLPLCVHSMYRYFDKTATDAFWLDGTLELMKRSDALFVISTAYRSSGSQREIAEAELLGLPIFYSVEALRAWRDQKMAA